MRDYAKLVILGSTALLVLLAVFLLLFWPHGPKQDDNKDSSLDSKTTDISGGGAGSGGQSHDGGAAGGGAAGGGDTHTSGVLPDTLELPQAEFKLPCDASLMAVVEKYYKAVPLNNGRSIPITPAQLPAITARLAKHNNITDGNATLPTGKVLKLPRVYVVTPGDSLTLIARKLYGSETPWKDIQKLNTDVLPKDLTKMKPDTVLVLP